MAITTKASQGTMPQVTLPVEGRGRSALFHSRRDQALILDKTCRMGYGVIEAGTIMGKDANGLLYPMAGNSNHSITILSDLTGGSTTTFNILLAEAYKLAEGETIVITDGTNTETLDIATSGIDITSSEIMATITVDTAPTNSYAAATPTVVYLANDTTGDYLEASFILDMDVDTGSGANARGGLCSVVLSNAILYKAKMTNIETALLTDLGAVDDDPYIILK